MYTVEDVYQKWVEHGIHHGWWDQKTIYHKEPDCWWGIAGNADPMITTMESTLWAWWMTSYPELLEIYTPSELGTLPGHECYASTKDYIQKMDEVVEQYKRGVPPDLLKNNRIKENLNESEVYFG